MVVKVRSREATGPRDRTVHAAPSRSSTGGHGVGAALLFYGGWPLGLVLVFVVPGGWPGPKTVPSLRYNSGGDARGISHGNRRAPHRRRLPPPLSQPNWGGGEGPLPAVNYHARMNPRSPFQIRRCRLPPIPTSTVAPARPLGRGAEQGVWGGTISLHRHKLLHILRATCPFKHRSCTSTKAVSTFSR